jgi:hypothetical protein
MNATYTIIIVIAVLVIFGGLLALVFSRRNRSKKLQQQFGTEYDLAVENMGGDKKAQEELENRKDHVKTLNIRQLTVSEHDRYTLEWAAVQSKFVDEPGEAIVEADRLITEVMQLRNYPISDFDQRAADISVKYPALVGNYRAARAIAKKNLEHTADTEELRSAMINFRSLFNELLVTKEG